MRPGRRHEPLLRLLPPRRTLQRQDPASHELVGILLDSYGLNPRETDIGLRLCRGSVAHVAHAS